MKKSFVIFVFLLLCSFPIFSQKTLCFDSNGKFKIVQFTDVHYIHNDLRALSALENIKKVISSEHPDLVIFTGDIIFGKPATESLLDVLDVVSSLEVPFALTFGNHDYEQGLSNVELYKLSKQYKMNVTGDYDVNSDYILKLHSSDGTGKCVGLLYCMDSHAYAQDKTVGGYGWFTLEQLSWYRKISTEFLSEYQASLPSLAFFHIPLPEYGYALSENTPMIGTCLERVCAPVINTGLFAAMRLQGDVMGIFVGHDHDNDFATLYRNILLCYGRYSGGNTVYNHLMNGARVIEMYEGKREFKSWVRLSDNSICNEFVYPESFLRK